MLTIKKRQKFIIDKYGCIQSIIIDSLEIFIYSIKEINK